MGILEWSLSHWLHCATVGYIIFLHMRLNRRDKWWRGRESVLQEEIEGPYWAREDYPGDLPYNHRQIIDCHDLLVKRIMGDARVNSSRRRHERLKIRQPPTD